MHIHIDRGSSTPISRQLIEQITAACAAGRWQAGERLPSVRQLARELTVNQNTILRVYEKLTAEGLLEMRHGEGTFVAARATRKQLAEQRRQFVDELSLVFRRGQLLGISLEELQEIAMETLAELHADDKQTSGRRSSTTKS